MEHNKESITAYQIEELQKSMTNIQTDMAEIKTIVVRMEERFGNFSTVNCALHSTNISTLQGRVEKVESEIDSFTPTLYKFLGGAMVVWAIIQVFVAPYVLDKMKTPVVDNYNNQPISNIENNRIIQPTFYSAIIP